MNNALFEAARKALANNPSEGQVEQSVVLPILKALGYKEENISNKESVKVKSGSKKWETLECDFVARDKTLPTLVVEAKSAKKGLVLPDDYNQGMSYCFSPDVKTSFLFLTSGYSSRLYESTNLIFEFDLKNVFANISLFKQALCGELKKDIERPAAQDIENFFSFSNNRMYSDGIKPAEALQILTKLSLIKTNEERGRTLYNLRTVLDYEEEYRNLDTSIDRKKRIEDSIYRYLSDCLKNIDTDLLYPEERVISRNLSVSVLFEIIKKLYGYTLDFIPIGRKGSVFDSFLNNTLKGKQLGQFFTHRNIVSFMVKVADLKLGSKVIDPACGTGGFIETTFIDMKEKLKVVFSEDSNDFKKRLSELQNNQIFGIEKDGTVASLAKLSMSMNGDGHTNIIKGDGLSFSDDRITEGTFDVVLTNPPFGSKSVVQVKDHDVLLQFDLGKQHKFDKTRGKYVSTGVVLDGQDIGVLFLEKCIKFLKDGGFMGIILHDGIFSNPTEGPVRQYLREKCDIVGLVKLNDEAFKPYSDGGGTETTILFCRKGKSRSPEHCFFGIANNVGYKYKRKQIVDASSDFKALYTTIKRKGNFGSSKWISLSKIPLYERLDPQFYCGKTKFTSNNFILLEELLKDKKFRTGFPFKSKYFGQGTQPFVKIRQLNNSLLNIDKLEVIPNDYYKKCKTESLEEGDILLAMDGKREFRASYIDTSMQNVAVNQRIAILRINKNKISPAYVFFVLISKLGQKQLFSTKTQTATVAHLSPTLIKNIKIPLLSKKAIKKIDKDFRNFSQSKRNAEIQFKRLEKAI